MIGVALALAASLSWGIADFGGGIGTRRVQVVWVLVVSQVAGLALVGALALVTQPHPPSGRELAWGAFGGVMGAVGLGSFYRALAVGTMGIVGPISATVRSCRSRTGSPAVSGLLPCKRRASSWRSPASSRRRSSRFPREQAGSWLPVCPSRFSQLSASGRRFSA
ncbi:MAG: EamA family transporter [Gaiellaceae bacterium]